MSYCVHCGVELAPSESACPLCETPVLDPHSPWTAPSSTLYPDKIENIKKHLNLRFGFRLSLLVLLTISALVIAVDSITADTLKWSYLVIGALVCFEVFVILPLCIKGYRPYMHISLDFAALAGYIFVIFLLSEGKNWYLHMALPLILCYYIFTMLVFFFIRRIENHILTRTSRVFACISLVLLATDAIVDNYLGSVFLNWSIFAGIPLIAISIFLFLLSRHKALRNSLHKRMFF